MMTGQMKSSQSVLLHVDASRWQYSKPSTCELQILHIEVCSQISKQNPKLQALLNISNIVTYLFYRTAAALLPE